MMAAPIWQPGTVYIPGDIVQPVSGTPAAGAPIVNPDITGSATGWTLPAQFSYDAGTSFTAGSGSIRFDTVGNGFFTFAATAGIAVDAGRSITARVMFQQGASDAGLLAGQVMLTFTDSGDSPIPDGTFLGTVINSGSGGAWAQSTVTAVAPAGAAFVRIGAAANRIGQNLPAWFDNFTWNYTDAATPAGLVYKAVQPASGVSGSQEPVWPSVLGVQVVDNTVTWEAIAATRVTWEASPLLVSGASEPTWPTQVGESVADGSIKWTAFSRRVEDVNCPNSKVVAIVASKVFAADGDIVRYCATANPLDWTTARDAGYLPTGLQQANANDMAVLNQYRSNLVAFNASSFQNWQADPDPEVMAILDQMDGIGSTWQQAARPVGNELFYLSQLGVRTVGIAGGSTNLQAGDVGMPVDPLVQESIKVAELNSLRTLSTYYPSAGQYWLVFPDYPPEEITIEGDMQDAFVGESGTFQYQISGGAGIKTATIVAGELPPGATMDSLGLVTFDYTTRGQYAWTVRVTDQLGNFADHDDGLRVYEMVWDYTWTFVADADLNGTGGETPHWAPQLGLVAYASGTGLPDYTVDGLVWNDGSPSFLNFNQVAWSPTLQRFAGGRDGTGSTAIYSDDGVNWQTGASVGPDFYGASCMCWADDLGEFFGLGGGAGGAFTGYRKSTDGINWTTAVLGPSAPGDARVIARGAGVYVAVSSANEATLARRIMWSADGVTWTGVGTFDTSFVDLKWVPERNLFLAVGATGTAIQRKVVSSPDGKVWTDVTPAGLTNDPNGIAYIPEMDLFALTPNTSTSLDVNFYTCQTPSVGGWTTRGTFPGGNFGRLIWAGAPVNKLLTLSFGGARGNGWAYSNTIPEYL